MIDQYSAKIRAISSGQSVVIYSANGCSSTELPLIIYQTSGAIIAPKANVDVGESITLSNSMHGTWRSSDNRVALVDANSGELTGVSDGTTTVTWTYTPTGGDISGAPDVFSTKVLTVDDPDDWITFDVFGSLGGFTAIGRYMQNKTYAWQQLPNSNNMVTNTAPYILTPSGYTSYPAGVNALINLEARPRESSIAVGLSVGCGVTVQSPFQLVYLIGPSIILYGKGTAQLIITGGLAGTYVDKLNNNLQAVADQQITYMNPINVQYHQELKKGLFVSVTCYPF